MAKTTPIRPGRPGKKAPPMEPALEDTPHEAVDIQPEPVESVASVASVEEPAPPAKKPAAKRINPENPPFFQRVAAVPKEDWGTRAFMYVYCTEPICNLKMLGENKYLFRSSQPIHDVQEIMEDYGSMKGYITLNLRKTGGDATDERDRHHFEIYNPKYPPKIPRRAWLSDPRNERWAALLPKEEPAPAPGSVGTFTEAIKAYTDIRRDIRDELQPDDEEADKSKPVDPWAAAEKILQMRSDNPMVTILMGQLDGMQKSAEAAREREFKAQEAAREREFKLQEQLRTQAAAAPASKGLFDQLVEFAAPTDKAEFVRKLFGGGSSANGDGQARAARTTGLDIARDIALKVFDGPVGEGLGAMIAGWGQKMANPNGLPVQMVNNGPQVHQAQQTPQAELWQFVETVLNPALLAQYPQGFSGASFAEWLYDGYPDRLLQFQQFTHPRLPGLRGAAAIIAGYKNSPAMWPILKLRGEEAFVQFVTEFCAWKPEGSDDAEDVEDVEESGVIDLDDAQEARVS